MKQIILIIFLALVSLSCVLSQEVTIDSVIYKQKDSGPLHLKIFYPPSMDTSKNYPAILFYQGGFWNYGKMEKFAYQAKYFARRGIICFLVEYGAKNTEGPRFFECISDAKSSIRYLRENAGQFNVDPNKIIAAGGSAGGHLAAALAMVMNYDDPRDNLLISSHPNALVLFNPALDLGPASPKLYENLGEKYKEISPLHNVKEGSPPTIILSGTADALIAVEMLKYYKLVMDSVNSRCDLILYEGERHGFFNFTRSLENYEKTVYEVDRFLNSLGYLKGDPTKTKKE